MALALRQNEDVVDTRLSAGLRRSWCVETSTSPDEWTQANPALGQCAVTALAIQDELGGELLRSTVSGVSHYWNRLPGGREVDLTFEQFGPGAAIETTPETRSREYVLSFPDTGRRYRTLCRRLRQHYG
jgi:hypothetical protein